MTSKAEKNKEKLEALRKNRISPTGAMVGALDTSPTVATIDSKEELSNVDAEIPPALESQSIISKQEAEEPVLNMPAEITEETDVPSEEENQNMNGVATEPKLPEFEFHEASSSPKGRFGKLKNKAKKQRVEDTHSRKTFLVRNDLLNELEYISQGIHGFKIEFINTAIENALKDYRDELEDE